MVLTGLMVVAGRQERIALVQSEPCVEAAATMEQQVRAATAALEQRWRAEVVKGEMAAKAVTAAEERVEATLWDHGKHEAPRGLLDELGVVALALLLLLLLLLLLSDGLVSMQPPLPPLPPLMQDLLVEPAIAQVLLHGRRRVQRS